MEGRSSRILSKLRDHICLFYTGLSLLANIFSLTVLCSGNILTEVRISSMLLALLINDMLALTSLTGSVVIFDKIRSSESMDPKDYMIGRCLYSPFLPTIGSL